LAYKATGDEIAGATRFFHAGVCFLAAILRSTAAIRRECTSSGIVQDCIPLKTWMVFRVVSQTTQQLGHS
jgi:hypothetical protein